MSDAAQVVHTFSGTAGVLSVTEPQQTIHNEETVINVSKWVCLAIAIVLIVSAAVLILNTIRMAIFARRREVSVMKLVGATNWFIRVPFMSEGLLQGLIGSLLAAVVVYFVYLFINHEGSGKYDEQHLHRDAHVGIRGLADQRRRGHRRHGDRLHRLRHRDPALPRRLSLRAGHVGPAVTTDRDLPLNAVLTLGVHHAPLAHVVHERVQGSARHPAREPAHGEELATRRQDIDDQLRGGLRRVDALGQWEARRVRGHNGPGGHVALPPGLRGRGVGGGLARRVERAELVADGGRRGSEWERRPCQAGLVAWRAPELSARTTGAPPSEGSRTGPRLDARLHGCIEHVDPTLSPTQGNRAPDGVDQGAIGFALEGHRGRDSMPDTKSRAVPFTSMQYVFDIVST